MRERSTERRRPRVPPSLLVGIAPVVVFATIEVIRARPGDDYERVGLTIPSVVTALLVPEAIAAVALALVVTGLGWWRIGTIDLRRGAPGWAAVAPIVILLIEAGRLATVAWNGRPLAYFLLLGLATLLVGFFEETMARGVLLVGLRRRLPELWVWMVSSAVFGCLHLLNALAGQGLGTTIEQVVFAAAFGSVLYIARRLTRTLLVPMLLHAVWDFGVIGAGAAGTSVPLPVVGFLGLLTFGILVFGVVAAAFVALHTDRPRRLAQRWKHVPPRSAFEVPAAVSPHAADGPPPSGPVSEGPPPSGPASEGPPPSGPASDAEPVALG
ncbi:type II CAAX endopeptidase family protein [Curtobacterium sp. MCBD17_040]|uniref:CPBP family intramembrane glutamic endopeptidase n=1 Tax=Curtobacterium sp. MCBD17_040 TaxID=2175674 RepID=UPI000DA918C4|nr:type II CAAX endopeptidase family protein [Curtobacterium sp. MCBD17_040]WIB64117.1 CPBP family glutamic-type intramembrane protease [Curtobacterium sp. MCBD17_040]